MFSRNFSTSAVVSPKAFSARSAFSVADFTFSFAASSSFFAVASCATTSDSSFFCEIAAFVAASSSARRSLCSFCFFCHSGRAILSGLYTRMCFMLIANCDLAFSARALSALSSACASASASSICDLLCPCSSVSTSPYLPTRSDARCSQCLASLRTVSISVSCAATAAFASASSVLVASCFAPSSLSRDFAAAISALAASISARSALFDCSIALSCSTFFMSDLCFSSPMALASLDFTRSFALAASCMATSASRCHLLRSVVSVVTCARAASRSWRK